MDSAGSIALRDEYMASVCYDDFALTFGRIPETGAADGHTRECIFCCKAVSSRPSRTRSGSLARVALLAGWSHTCHSRASVTADAGSLSGPCGAGGAACSQPPAAALGPHLRTASGLSPDRCCSSSCVRQHASFFLRAAAVIPPPAPCSSASQSPPAPCGTQVR